MSADGNATIPVTDSANVSSYDIDGELEEQVQRAGDLPPTLPARTV